MNLTGHELTAASSAVAALAIIGGYLGVRSANRNAIKIAREERSSRRHDELDAQKRVIYARCMEALFTLNTASIGASAIHHREPEIRQQIDAALAAHDAVLQVELIAPERLHEQACVALASASAREEASAFTREGIKLRAAMRNDLRGADVPSPEELDRIADKAISDTDTATRLRRQLRKLGA